MSKLLQIKQNSDPLPCHRCDATYAAGIYLTPKGLTQLCASCALDVKQCKQVIMFNYSRHPDDVDEWEQYPSTQPEKITRRIAPLTAIALRRASAHDPHFATVTDQLHKGNERGQWAKRVCCSGCGITYTAVREKLCPSCGQLNKPTNTDVDS